MSEFKMPESKSNELQAIFFNDGNGHYMPETPNFSDATIEMFVVYSTNTLGKLMISFTVGLNSEESKVSIRAVDRESDNKVFSYSSASIKDLYDTAMAFVDAQE